MSRRVALTRGADDTGPLGRAGSESGRFDSGSFAILPAKGVTDRAGFVGLHQGHRTAAKSAAGHPRTDHATLASDRRGDIHQEIQFRTTHFVVVAEGIVAGVHQFTHSDPITAFDGVGRFHRPLDLTDDMSRTTIEFIGQLALGVFEHFHGCVAQCVNTKNLADFSQAARRCGYSLPVSSCFTLLLVISTVTAGSSSGTILASWVRQSSNMRWSACPMTEMNWSMIPHGIRAYSCSAFWQSKRLGDGIQSPAGDRLDERCRGDFEGRTARQPAAERHVAVNDGLKRPRLEALVEAAGHHALQIARPVNLARADIAVHGDRGRSFLGRTEDASMPVPRRFGRPVGHNHHAPLDRHGQHESGVVVGMLSDQVDAAWSRHNPTRTPSETLVEEVDGFLHKEIL